MRRFRRCTYLLFEIWIGVIENRDNKTNKVCVTSPHIYNCCYNTMWVSTSFYSMEFDDLQAVLQSSMTACNWLHNVATYSTIIQSSGNVKHLTRTKEWKDWCNCIVLKKYITKIINLLNLVITMKCFWSFVVEPADSRSPAQRKLDTFFEEQLSEDPKTCDSLLWWKRNWSCFPTLSPIASKFLAPTSTSVASERLFSTAGNICTDNRSSLLPEKLEKLIFLKCNVALLDFQYWITN